MRLKYEKVIHRAIVNNLFGLGYTKKSCNAQGSSKYYLFVTAPSYSSLSLRIEIVLLYEMIKTTSTMKAYIPMSRNAEI